MVLFSFHQFIQSLSVGFSVMRLAYQSRVPWLAIHPVPFHKKVAFQLFISFFTTFFFFLTLLIESQEMNLFTVIYSFSPHVKYIYISIFTYNLNLSLTYSVFLGEQIIFFTVGKEKINVNVGDVYKPNLRGFSFVWHGFNLDFFFIAW